MAALVLVSWAAVLAWHAKREYLRPASVRLAEASANLVPASSFFSVKLGGATIGYAASRIDTLPDGFLLEDDLRLRVRALGSDAPAFAHTTVKLGERLELERFEFSLKSDFGQYRVEAEQRGDSTLDIRLNAGGDEQTMTLETDGPILLPQVMPLHFALGEQPEPGDRYSYEVFDPSVMDYQTVTVEVLGQKTLIYPDSVEFDEASAKWVTVTADTVDTWHVSQTFGGVEIETWLDPDGLAVRATSPLGYTLDRTAFEIAWHEYRQASEGEGPLARDTGTDIIENTAISLGADLRLGDRVTGLAVRLLNVDLAGFDLDGARQTLRGDTLFIRTEEPRASMSYTLPASADDWREQLAATPLIQANDSKVRELAERVVGDTRDPGQAARRLSRWIYENLEKEVTLSVPSAVQVLDARRGDCNEHTVLYVAMARSIGLPTRTAAGLVYVRGSFYYHAWPEVWLDGWVPVDPTLGQFPADASHLRFVIGGLARQVELVRLIGMLDLDVVSVEEL